MENYNNVHEWKRALKYKEYTVLQGNNTIIVNKLLNSNGENIEMKNKCRESPHINIANSSLCSLNQNCDWTDNKGSSKSLGKNETPSVCNLLQKSLYLQNKINNESNVLLSSKNQFRSSSKWVLDGNKLRFRPLEKLKEK